MMRDADSDPVAVARTAIEKFGSLTTAAARLRVSRLALANVALGGGTDGTKLLLLDRARQAGLL